MIETKEPEQVKQQSATKPGKPSKDWWRLVVFRMPPDDVTALQRYAYARRRTVSDVIRSSLIDTGVLPIREEA